MAAKKNKELSLAVIEDKITKDDEGKFDEVVLFGDVHFKDSEHVEVAGRTFSIQEAAKNHICRKLGIPAFYWKRCPEKLRMQNLDYWYKEQDPKKEVLLRYKNDALRALFSPKYTIADNELILKTIKDVVPVKFIPTTFDLTEGTMLLRFSLPETKKLVKESDPVFTGFQVRSSEVGASCLLASTIVWRQVCKNGMWGFGHDHLFSERHIFKTAEEMMDGFKRAILNCVTADGKILTQFVALQKKRLDVEIETKQLHERGIGKKTLQLVRENIEEETMYGWVNAITSVARDLPVDRRLELEKVAGQYLKVA